jgi:hypothetical protein
MARYLNWWRNPMARRTDRIESMVATAAATLFLLSVPLAAWCGKAMYASGAARAETDQATGHRGSAVLLAAAPSGTAAGIDAAPADPWVRAQWATRDGGTSTGDIQAPPDSPAGTRVPIWLDGADQPSAPPASHATVTANAVCCGICVLLGIGGGLEAARRLTRSMLDRSRLADWETAWEQTGPRWTWPAR